MNGRDARAPLRQRTNSVMIVSFAWSRPARARVRAFQFRAVFCPLVAFLALGLCSPLPVQAQAGSPATAEEQYRQGRAHFSAGRFDLAAARFEAALGQVPTASLYAQWLGRAYGLQARNSSLLARPGLALKSRAALEKAVALDPDNVGARSDLAAFYHAAPGFMGGGRAKALAQVAEIARRDPYLGKVRTGDMLWDDKKMSEAEAQYRAAESLDARRPEAPGRLAWLFTQAGRYDEAFARWDALLAAKPGDPRALAGLGRTADLSGRRLAEGEAALRAFLQGASASADTSGDGPTPARVHYRLGNLLRRRGELGEAKTEYETALRLDPKSTEARDALRALPGE